MTVDCLGFIKWGEEKTKKTTRERIRAAFIGLTHTFFPPVYTYAMTVISSSSLGKAGMKYHCQGCCSHQNPRQELETCAGMSMYSSLCPLNSFKGICIKRELNISFPYVNRRHKTRIYSAYVVSTGLLQ